MRINLIFKLLSSRLGMFKKKHLSCSEKRKRKEKQNESTSKLTKINAIFKKSTLCEYFLNYLHFTEQVLVIYNITHKHLLSTNIYFKLYFI